MTIMVALGFSTAVGYERRKRTKCAMFDSDYAHLQ